MNIWGTPTAGPIPGLGWATGLPGKLEGSGYRDEEQTVVGGRVEAGSVAGVWKRLKGKEEGIILNNGVVHLSQHLLSPLLGPLFSM